VPRRDEERSASSHSPDLLGSPLKSNFASLRGAGLPGRIQGRSRLKTTTFPQPPTKHLPTQVPEEDDSQQQLQASHEQSRDYLRTRQLGQESASEIAENKELDQSAIIRQTGWQQEAGLDSESKDSGLAKIEQKSFGSDGPGDSSLSEMSQHFDHEPVKRRKPQNLKLPLENSLDDLDG